MGSGRLYYDLWLGAGFVSAVPTAFPATSKRQAIITMVHSERGTHWHPLMVAGRGLDANSEVNAPCSQPGEEWGALIKFAFTRGLTN